MRWRATTIGLITAAMFSGFVAIKARSADDNPASATANVEKIMDLIGQGKIDEAMAGDFLQDTPDERQAMRDRLIHLRDDRKQNYGYDIAAVQAYSPRFQNFWALQYYDRRPVLLQIEMYRATGRVEDPWSVIDFHIEDNPTDALKDLPITYPASRKG